MKEFAPDRMWEMDFNGTWQVVSSPDFEDDYLNLRVPAQVTLRQNGDFVMGEFEIGLRYGTLNRGVYEEFIDFDFEGNSQPASSFAKCVEQVFPSRFQAREGRRQVQAEASFTSQWLQKVEQQLRIHRDPCGRQLHCEELIG